MSISRTLMLNLIILLSFTGLAVQAETNTDKKSAVTVTETSTTDAKEEAAKKLELVATLTTEWFSERQKLPNEQNTELARARTAKQANLLALQKNLEELTAKEKLRAAQAEQSAGRAVVASAADKKEDLKTNTPDQPTLDN